MKKIDEAIKDAEIWSLKEIKLTGSHPLNLHKICVENSVELAKKYNADKFIIKISVELMDIKLGESIKQGETQKHVENSELAAKIFLDKYDLTKETKNKILACVREHHLAKFSSKEAEICANADCYKFLTLKGFILFVAELQKREMNYEDAIKYAYEKFKEKRKILTLKESVAELSPQMNIIEEIVNIELKKEKRK